MNAKTKDDEGVLDECREELVKLQSGDEGELGDLEKVRRFLASRVRQNLRATRRFVRSLPRRELFQRRTAARSWMSLLRKVSRARAMVRFAFFPTKVSRREKDPFKIQRDGEWNQVPSMIQKRDGGFGYATTDLATVDYRVNEWKADQIWYVVGAPQQLHFRQVFDAARMVGPGHHKTWSTSLSAAFWGRIVRRLRTRSGENVGLQEVLTEAIERSLAVFGSTRIGGRHNLFCQRKKKPNCGARRWLGCREILRTLAGTHDGLHF